MAVRVLLYEASIEGAIRLQKCAPSKAIARFFNRCDGIIVSLVLSAVWLSACNKSSSPIPDQSQRSTAPTSTGPHASTSDDENAVRKAIEEHVRSNPGLNMSALEMSVDGVRINGDQAQANASFRLKQGDASMSVTYSLVRGSDGWHVVKNQPGGGQFAHPPMDQAHSSPSPIPADPSFPDLHQFMNKQAPSDKN